MMSLFKSERLSTNIKLTLHKALIRSVMTYACPACEFAADTHLIKFQCLQNKVLRTIGNFPRRTLRWSNLKSKNSSYMLFYLRIRLCGHLQIRINLELRILQEIVRIIWTGDQSKAWA
jgi:hypothetical protein